MTPPRHAPPRHQGRLALMIFAIAGMNIGYTAILPFLPQMQRELRLTPALLTAFLLAYPAAKIISQAFAGGRLTDRCGPAIAAALAWTTGAAGMLMIALASGPLMAVAGRLVWGAGTGVGIPAIYLSTSHMSEHYGVPLARLRGAVGAGAVLTLALGPVVAGLVHLFAGFRVALLISAGLSVVGAVASALAMRLPGRAAAARETTGRRNAPAAGWLLPLAVFASYELILNLLFSATEPLVPLYVALHSRDPAGRSALILTAGLAVWVVVTLLSGRGPERLRTPGTGTVSLVLLAVACLGLAEIGSLPLALAAIAVFMFAQGHGYLVARTGIDTHTDASGAVWGRFNAVGDIGFLIGPFAAVTAFTYARELAFPLLGAVTLGAAACYAGLCLVLRRRGAPQPADSQPADSQPAGSRPEARSSAAHV